MLLFIWLFSGCTYVSQPEPDTAAKLTHLLLTLDTDVQQEEAARLSRDILYRSIQLEHNFDRTTLPWVHNFMVNTGLKKKGLCYQYADGLYVYLKKRSYPHFDLHLAGAHIGEYWREHNTLVVTAKGSSSIKEGVVVDPWRETGRVFVSMLKNDNAYVWVHRPEREYK